MRIKSFLSLYRLDVFIVTGGTSLFGHLLAYGSISRLALLQALFISSFLYNYVYVLNALTDMPEDTINKPHRPLPSGKITFKSALIYFASIFIASVIGILILFKGTSLFAAFLVLIIGGIYSLPPFELKKIPLVAPFITGWGLVHPMFITGNRHTFLYTIALMAFATGSTLLKDLSDIEGDKQAGRKVITDIISLKNILLLSFSLMMLSFLIFLFFLDEKSFVIIPLGTSSTVLVHFFRKKEDIMKNIYSRIIKSVIASGLIVLFIMVLF